MMSDLLSNDDITTWLDLDSAGVCTPDTMQNGVRPIARLPVLPLNVRSKRLGPGECFRFAVESSIDLRPVALWVPPFVSRFCIITSIVVGRGNLLVDSNGIPAKSFSYTKRVRPNLSFPILRCGTNAWIDVENQGKKPHTFSAWFECLDVRKNCLAAV